MKGLEIFKKRFAQLGLYALGLSAIWTFVVLASLLWNVYQVKQTMRKLSVREARAHFNKDQAFRFWGTSHGGVYVPIDERTTPNPHLKHLPERDITTPSGIKLTMMNPAYMVRQFLEEFSDLYNIPGSITSLKPLMPSNAPDQWERTALEAFERGVKEVMEFTTIKGEPYLRLIKPMITKENCLKCHRIQGYKVGDVQGGVGVSVPLSPYLVQDSREIKQFLLTHALLWFIGLVGITFAHRRLRSHIAERNKAEELRKSETFLRTIFDGITDPIHLIDKNFRVLMTNKTLLNLKGLTQEKAIGKYCYEIYQDRNSLCDECAAWEVFKTGRKSKNKKLLPLADGSFRHFEVSAFPINDEDGNVFQVIEATRDITEKKKLEAQLLHAGKMKAIGTLAGGVAHDFNNLLQAIMGYTQMLLLNKPEDDPEFENLMQIDKSAKRASELTKQLLTFSRKVESKLRPVNLNREVKQVEKLLKRTIPKMIDIKLNLKEDIRVINADPDQIEQVLMNLAVNARDAMPDGGKIFVETENMILDEEYCKTHLWAMPVEYVLLSVSDTGHGMDKETVEHIFEPFYTTKETGKGTGLGLSMVYGVVKSHGGHIMCYSEPGEGTMFKIYFPAIESVVSRELSVERKKEMPGGNETILLVDDDEAILNIGKNMLERFGYTAITAESGERALEIYKSERNRIDLIILDLNMPGMGGHKCIRELLKIDTRIKVIIASGYAESGKVKETVESGAAGFIQKPYQIADILKKVRETIED